MKFARRQNDFVILFQKYLFSLHHCHFNSRMPLNTVHYLRWGGQYTVVETCSRLSDKKNKDNNSLLNIVSRLIKLTIASVKCVLKTV